MTLLDRITQAILDSDPELTVWEAQDRAEKFICAQVRMSSVYEGVLSNE